MKRVVLLLATVATCYSGQPQLKTLKVTWDPYIAPAGVSNLVVVLYKSTSLGTVFSPAKPTAYFPASRTNGTISVLPGTYHFYATVQGQPLPESTPSNITTNIVSP